jgi:HEAT repeat protein
MARTLLTSDDPKERLRAIDRLGTIGDAPAVEALLEAVDAGSPASRDPDVRLLAIRMLADHAEETRVRSLLSRELSGGSGGKASLVRSTAAMALARRGDEKALEALALAVDQRGPASDAARAALLAYPPANLDPFLYEPREEETGDAEGRVKSDASRPRPEAAAKARTTKEARAREPSDEDDEGDEPEDEPKKKPKGRRARSLSLPMIDLLSDLGDLRALPALRAAAQRKQLAVKSRAGLALAKLGDPTGLADARTWAKGDDLRLAATAAETLAALGDEGVKLVLPRLLKSRDQRAAALSILEGCARPEWVQAAHKDLEALLKEEQGPERSRLLVLLSRFAPDHAVGELDRGPEESRDAAAMALATSPSALARDALTRRLQQPKDDAQRRRLVRAAIARSVALGETIDGLREALDRLSRSRDEADRELGAFGRVALGDDAETVLHDAEGKGGSTPSTAVIAGAARATILVGDDPRPFGAWLKARPGEDLAADRPSLRQVAAGIALVDEASAGEVPLRSLLAWAEGGGALAPLAARALGARDDETVRPRIVALLAGSDPVIRAHVALGLAMDPEPSATSVLGSRYVEEVDPSVRRAIVAALAHREEPQRERVLRWASGLDPDEAVRSVARLALEGRPPERRALEGGGAPLGATLSLTRVLRAEGPPTMTPARFAGAGGLSLPVVTSPDGALLMPAPAWGPARLSPKPGDGEDDDAGRREAGAHAAPRTGAPRSDERSAP